MVALFSSFSPTRWLGIGSYILSLTACLVAWRRGRGDRETSRIFGTLTGVQLLLLMDMFFEWRWALHGFWVEHAMQAGLYGERRGPQRLVLILLALAGTSLLIWIMLALRERPGATAAVAGSVLGVGLWCCECISYHDMDGILYRMEGKFMLVSLLWLGIAIVTSTGAWLDSLNMERGRFSR
jgi:hypothetical protein